MPGAWRAADNVVLMEMFVPFRAYDMLALTAADPVQAFHDLKRELQNEFNVRFKLPLQTCECMTLKVVRM